MAAADVQQPPAEPAPAIPDYLATPNATLGDKGATWRYGKAPDYSKTRQVWEQTKQMNHEAGSLPQLVENLVKNWEVEASFKSELKDWRTVDHANYTFAINGGPPQSAEHMLKVGTYNAILDDNEYYSPKTSDFASSHKTFKRMMPTFAWEVLEVYSGPPRVAFKWRHWGTMKNDYVGFNNKGEKVTAKAHGGPIDITGITIATVNDKVQLQEVNTYFDPMTMFRQIAPEGIVNKEIVNKQVDPSSVSDTPSMDGLKISEHYNAPSEQHSLDTAPLKSGEPSKSETMPTDPEAKTVTGAQDIMDAASAQKGSVNVEHVESNVKGGVLTQSELDSRPVEAASGSEPSRDRIDDHLERAADVVHPHPKDMEEVVHPTAGQAVVVPADSEETRLTHEEMSKLSAGECPFLMNRE